MLGSQDTKAEKFSSRNTGIILRQDTSMRKYRLYLKYMQDKEGKHDMHAIQAKIGKIYATLFYNHTTNTGILLCGPGAYYCDCTWDVEAFIACLSNNCIHIHAAALMCDDTIYLESIDDEDTDRDLKIQLNKPYP